MLVVPGRYRTAQPEGPRCIARVIEGLHEEVNADCRRLVEVSADEILEAIAEGRDVDVEYADIHGELDVRKVSCRLRRDKANRLFIDGKLKIKDSEIHGETFFSVANSSDDIDFSCTRFVLN